MIAVSRVVSNECPELISILCFAKLSTIALSFLRRKQNVGQFLHVAASGERSLSDMLFVTSTVDRLHCCAQDVE